MTVGQQAPDHEGQEGAVRLGSESPFGPQPRRGLAPTVGNGGDRDRVKTDQVPGTSCARFPITVPSGS